MWPSQEISAEDNVEFMGEDWKGIVVQMEFISKL